LLLISLALPLIIGNGVVIAAGGTSADADPRLQLAVTWATQQLSVSKLWLEDGSSLCGKFVENAFGVTAQYPTAHDMYLALEKSSDPAQRTLASLQRAPAGVIVFFAQNAGNDNNGHVGIYLGNDQFIGVVTSGHVRQHGVQWWDEHTSRFLGWAYPRADWPGYGKSKPIARAAPAAPPAPSAQAIEGATRAFQAQWNAGEVVMRNLWGPSRAAPEQEPYSDASGGYRMVQYFDKGRMEADSPTDNTVTFGLLATELITGKVQVGKTTFQSRDPADIPIVGDAGNAGPTYADLNGRAAKLLAPMPSRPSMAVSADVSAAGDVSETSATSDTDVRTVAKSDTTLTTYDGSTQHNVPAAFAAYRAKIGVAVIGYAKSEPFITTVKVAGAPRQVMVQVFERRVLTYNAANSDAFKVEMGNIGQHYHRWRYER